MTTGKTPFSITFNKEQETALPVFVITEFMNHYAGMGRAIQRQFVPHADALYIGIQSLRDMGEISPEDCADILAGLKTADDAIKQLEGKLSNILHHLHANHHVEPQAEGETEEISSEWPDMATDTAN